MSENWKDVHGFEGRYEVSDLGRVRSSRTRTSTKKGKILRLQTTTGGYLRAYLYQGNRKYAYKRVHHLVLESFVGARPEGMESLHINGNETDNRKENLRWGTRSENTKDQVRHGTHHMSRKVLCPRQHPLSEPNLVKGEVARGGRSCLACARASQYARSHELPFTKELADLYYERIFA